MILLLRCSVVARPPSTSFTEGSCVGLKENGMRISIASPLHSHYCKKSLHLLCYDATKRKFPSCFLKKVSFNLYASEVA
jgi:hypothetical protein